MARSKCSQECNNNLRTPSGVEGMEWLEVRTGLKVLVPKGTQVPQQERSSQAQFKPLVLEHTEKDGSPLLHSSKEVKNYLKSKELISPLFS